AVEGYRSHLSVMLDGDGVGVIVMANRSDVRANQLAHAGLALAIGARSEQPSSSIGDPSPDEDVLGLWFDDREMAVMSVTRTDHGLAVDFGATKLELAPAGPGRWTLSMN